VNVIINTIISQLNAMFNPETLGVPLTNLFAKLIIEAIVLPVFYLGWLVVFASLRIIFRHNSINEMTSTFLPRRERRFHSLSR